MAVKVCKFGGTSMADGNVIQRVKSIIESDAERRYIVVSAPGKRFSGDIKVTDLLYACYDELKHTGTCEKSFVPVCTRFRGIVRQLQLDINIDRILELTRRRIEKERSEDFTASRGEYLSAYIMSEVLGAKFIDTEEVIFFDKNGFLDGERSYKAISAAAAGEKLAVFPGFYGKGANGKVKTFSRGGSDITGAVVARALSATLYENWTDVSGFLACDPALVDSPKRIKMLSYKELRELSYMGANVLHADSIFPVRKANIPVQIKNTFSPEDEGTSIVPSSIYRPSGNVVTGISGKKNFTVIFIEKSLMNSEIGFMRKVLTVVEQEGVSIEHVPSGIDTMSLIVASDKIEGKLDKIVDGVKRAVQPDTVRVIENIALISTVGHGMSASVGTSARLFNAIADAGINIRMIDQGSSELNIMVGVSNEDYERCIKAIYFEFFGK